MGTITWQSHSPVDRPVEDGEYFFHRNTDGQIPGCAVYLRRKEPGHLYVPSITPDTYDEIPLEELAGIIQEFDKQIAEPAALELDGMTSIGTSKHSLEDYFSQESIDKLSYFCTSSNGYGSHPSDQEKWRTFLLHVHHKNKAVHCDIFGELLKAKQWWPEDGIQQLVREYDFAMSLLEQADRI